jgi:hypothetical protein
MSTTHRTICDFCEKELAADYPACHVYFGGPGGHGLNGSIAADACSPCYARLVDTTKGKVREVLRKEVG